MKPADTPAETASIPADPRRHAPAPRDKVRVVLPSPVQAVTPAVAPAAAAPVPAPPIEAASVPDERRDANDLARAAIERLRGGENPPRQQEARAHPEAPRTEAPRIEAPRVAPAPALRPLPPPITVSTPAGEPLDQGSQAQAALRGQFGNRPAPPDAAGRHPGHPPARPACRGDASRLRASTRRSPKTCCRQRSRCSTPSCRSNRLFENHQPGLLARFAADAGKAASRGFVFRTDGERAAIRFGRLGLVAEPLVGLATG